MCPRAMRCSASLKRLHIAGNLALALGISGESMATCWLSRVWEQQQKRQGRLRGTATATLQVAASRSACKPDQGAQKLRHANAYRMLGRDSCMMGCCSMETTGPTFSCAAFHGLDMTCYPEAPCPSCTEDERNLGKDLPARRRGKAGATRACHVGRGEEGGMHMEVRVAHSRACSLLGAVVCMHGLQAPQCPCIAP